MRRTMKRSDLADGIWGMGVGSTELVYVERLLIDASLGYFHGG